MRSPPPGDDYLRAGSVTLIVHQEGVCILMVALMIALAAGSIGVRDWWEGSWGRVDSYRPLAALARHSLYATFAVELKDCLDGPSAMTLPFWIHHLATFAGLAMCLFVDAGVGLVTTVGCVAEVGSGFYNLLALWPRSRLAFGAYVLVMNAFPQRLSTAPFHSLLPQLTTTPLSTPFPTGTCS